MKLSEEKEYLFGKDNNNYKLSIGQALNILQVFRNNGLILDQETEKKGKEEKDKQEILNYLNGLFSKKYLIYEETETQKMVSLLNDKTNQKFFLEKLNDFRNNLKFFMNKNALQNLGYLFQYLNELITKNFDAKLFNLLLIMLFTFYSQDNDTCSKYYLYRYLENSPSYKNRKLWENYLEDLIVLDIKESSYQDIELNYFYFLNTMSVINSMCNLHLGKDFISDFIEYSGTKYKLKDDQLIQVNYILNDKECGSFNDKERSTISTEINDLNQNLHNSIDNINLNISNDNRTSSISNIIISKMNENDDKKKESDDKQDEIDDKKNESDGSVESIDVEFMTKK